METNKRQPILLSIVFAIVCTASALALVYTKHESRKLFVELEELLHWEILDGAVGAYNGIVIADLDDVTGNELYVATTLGVRKFAF